MIRHLFAQFLYLSDVRALINYIIVLFLYEYSDSNYFISPHVLDVPPTPGRPKIQNLKDTSAVLEWETFSNTKSKASQDIQCKYKLEACRLRSSESWITINADVETITNGDDDANDSRRFCTVHSLKQGETYTFRVISVANSISGSKGERNDTYSEPSPPSNPLTIPLGDIPLSGNAGPTSQGTLSSRRSSTSSGSGSCSTAGSLHVS